MHISATKHILWSLVCFHCMKHVLMWSTMQGKNQSFTLNIHKFLEMLRFLFELQT